MVENPSANARHIDTWVPSLGWKDPLKEEMATHSSILDWKIPWTEDLTDFSVSDKESDTTKQLN